MQTKTDSPWQASHYWSQDTVLGMPSASPAEVNSISSWGPLSGKYPPHVPHDPLSCPEFTKYPTDVVNLPACGGAQGGHILPTQPGQLLLREGTLEKMGPVGHGTRLV